MKTFHSILFSGLALFLVLPVFGGATNPVLPFGKMAHSREFEQSLRAIQDPLDPAVFVVGHRGDWRNAPENSLLAIEYCIQRDVEIVEIDVRRTADGVFVLMHDETVNRTTTGEGRVEDMTAAEVAALRLTNGLGNPTELGVPTLRGALLSAKGRVLLNLDKCDDYLSEVVPILRETGTIHQVILKSRRSYEEARLFYGDLLTTIHFMPIIMVDEPDSIKRVDAYLNHLMPLAFELVFQEPDSPNLKTIQNRLEGKSRIWINTLYPELCGRHDDERAIYDPEMIYSWILARGASIIQTDRLDLLIHFLNQKNPSHALVGTQMTEAPTLP